MVEGNPLQLKYPTARASQHMIGNLASSIGVRNLRVSQCDDVLRVANLTFFERSVM
jgi:hypothetical protein